MERLTERDEFGNADIIGVNSCEFQLRLRFDEFNLVTDALNRLAAYEDTGLEPQEIPTGLEMAQIAMILQAYRASGLTPDDLPRAAELYRAEKEGLCVMLDTPRKPLIWDDDHEAIRCPDCGADLMGIPYGERMALQCPECGEYIDATKTLTRSEAEVALQKGVE